MGEFRETLVRSETNMSSTAFHTRASKGTTVVEFALVLPIFALLLCAIIEFGYYFFVEHTIQFATREGTRIALVGATMSGLPPTAQNREAAIVQTIQSNASTVAGAGDLSISIFPVNSDYSNPTGWSTKQDPGAGGQYMRVVVQYTFHFWTPLIGNFFPSGQSVITAQALYHNELF